MSREHTHKINVMDRSEVPVDHETVEAMAYQLWVQRGCPVGSDQEDWYQAEAELKGQEPSEPTGGIVTTGSGDSEDLIRRPATGARASWLPPRFNSREA